MSLDAATQGELEEHLREQLRFLEIAAAAYDGGEPEAAKMLATTLRVLLHDTNKSHSVLGQLGRKETLDFVDTADAINPNDLSATPGLVILKGTFGEEIGGEYVPPLGELLMPSRRGKTKKFDCWWNDDVTVDAHSNRFRRRDYVLTVANKEGGAHVDLKVSEAWKALTRDNSLGWMYQAAGVEPQPFDGNAGLASLRQITYEVQQTLASI